MKGGGILEKSDTQAENKAQVFDVYQLKKLCKSELINNGLCNSNICGYTKESLRDFIEKPWLHTNKLISIMNFIYFSSGYFRKLIQYYINLVISDCWTVDTEYLIPNKSGINKDKFKKDYFKYVKEVEAYDLSNVLPKILFDVFLYDAYFGYEINTDDGKVLFAFAPEDCIITGYNNGMPCFAVRKNVRKIKTYPNEIQEIFNDKNAIVIRGAYVQMPFEKTFCIKYNDGYDFLYPPFAFIIKEILDVEDFKEIEKTKAENEVYKLIAMKIPTDQNGQPTMNTEQVAPFYELAMDVVSRAIGILPAPFDVTPIEFTTRTSDNINRVKNAIDVMYSEIGVSQSLLSGASNGSELKTSIEVDASEVYRVLKQVSKAVNFHCRINLVNNPKYKFTFRYLDITPFNQGEKVDRLLKMAQASLPVKSELMAAMGNNPIKMLGNTFVENDVFELAENWIPMQTSYTQSSSDIANSDNNGRPTMDDTEISEITQNTRDNEGNDKDNRV